MITALMIAAMASPMLNVDSGLDIGKGVTPFHPQHVTGPNKGTDACPP